MNETLNLFDQTFAAITRGSLGNGLQYLTKAANQCKNHSFDESINQIKNDFALMKQYVMNGYKDDERVTIYENLLFKSYDVYQRLKMEYLCANIKTFNLARQATKTFSPSFEEIEKHMEDYVQDEAVASLQPQNNVTLQKINVDHQNLIRNVFPLLLVKPQLSEHEQEQLEHFFTSLFVEQRDQCVLLSALTLSCMAVFDVNKLHVLAACYTQSQDIVVRQRALVGLLLCMPHEHLEIFSEIDKIVDALSAVPDIKAELLDLQKQMLMCINSDEDVETINKELMPDILSAQQEQLKKFGLQDDEKTEDIIHPELEDEKIEKMEKNIQRIQDMQKQGTDIFFGGFSQMKRYHFFSTIENWFMPFFMEHPDIASINSMVAGLPFLEHVLKVGPFCDSDKYSFALSFAKTFTNLPQAMQDALKKEENFSIIGEELDHNSAAYVRRMYIQDLYRFFRLSDYRLDFPSLFVSNQPESYLLVTSPYMLRLIGPRLTQLQLFLLKHKRYNDVLVLSQAMSKNNYDQSKLYQGLALLRMGKYTEAIKPLAAIYQLEGDTGASIAALAKAYFCSGDFENAGQLYTILHEKNPDNLRFVVNLTLCLIRSANYDKASNIIYEAYYHHADNRVVKRTLAWTLLNAGKAAKAQDMYLELLDPKDADVLPDDYLGAAYTMLIAGNVKQSINYLQNFRKLSGGKSLGKTITADLPLLLSYGITRVYVNMVLSMM